MKKRMTRKYVHPEIQFADLFHPNFDLYGFTRSMKEMLRLGKGQILESRRNEVGEENYKKLTDIITGGERRPTQIDIGIEDIASELKGFAQQLSLLDRVSEILNR